MSKEIIYFYNVEDEEYYESRYTHEWLENLIKENKQLKEQNKEIEKECINQRESFHKDLDKAERIAQQYKDRYYNEKLEFKNQLKQRDEAIEFLKEFHNYENRFKWCEEDYITTILAIEKILKKYKGDSNE